jgi:hypothetical protein
MNVERERAVRRAHNERWAERKWCCLSVDFST